MRVALLDLGCDLPFLIIGHVYPDPNGIASGTEPISVHHSTFCRQQACGMS
jgi:hypothetical protein